MKQISIKRWLMALVVFCMSLSMTVLADTPTKVNVPKMKLSSVTSGSAGKMTVSWKKVSKVKSYQIVVARNKAFTSGVKWKTVAAGENKKTISGLKQGSRYYVKIRARKDVKGKRYYGKFSSVKSVVIKKKASSNSNSGSYTGGGGTVYWTPSGSVYHSTAGCPTLSRSRNVCSGSVAQSGRSRGCKVCY
ncbi:MAG: fibronectin type III domain-containing protein [Lachnospiraceae bacterium]|nr:fibronectin type III domain-containing protein [Lachnospiraceae bacterium]